MGRGEVSEGGATQASPPFSTPPPPLRGMSHLPSDLYQVMPHYPAIVGSQCVSHAIGCANIDCITLQNWISEHNTGYGVAPNRRTIVCAHCIQSAEA